jgi:hypothetical protein
LSGAIKIPHNNASLPEDLDDLDTSFVPGSRLFASSLPKL